MVKWLHCNLGYLSVNEKMHRRGIRAHYEQLSEFERGRIIELKEVGWANRRIARHMGRSDAAIRRHWQGWVETGRFQGNGGSGRPRATADREDSLIVRSAVTASNSSLSPIRRTTRTRVSIMTIHRADRAKFTLILTATPPVI
ncbi:HTH_Tnp_Tc3_2 domain-containing protein [Trichonephila clavipes]|nr:HTH_Tnp_Tc3_2 domain-containing protein [Trichonephila clavipes]